MMHEPFKRFLLILPLIVICMLDRHIVMSEWTVLRLPFQKTCAGTKNPDLPDETKDIHARRIPFSPPKYSLRIPLPPLLPVFEGCRIIHVIQGNALLNQACLIQTSDIALERQHTLVTGSLDDVLELGDSVIPDDIPDSGRIQHDLPDSAAPTPATGNQTL